MVLCLEKCLKAKSGRSHTCPTVLTVGIQHPKQPQRNLIARTVVDVDGQIGVGYAFNLLEVFVGTPNFERVFLIY